MARTQSTKIIRKLAGPDASIFNDKMANGDRSIKVWRWGDADYKKAKKALEAAGLKVVLTTCVSYSYRAGGHYNQTRLRVTE